MEQSQMSKFCIDLKGADLADIVDQICIAWHGANCKAQIEITADWAEKLRIQIKSKHGKGWSLDAVGESKFNPHGKCRMQYKKTNQKRVGVVLPIEWRPENFDKIFHIADAVITIFLVNDVSLKEALNAAVDRTADSTAHQARLQSRAGAIDAQ
jgi:hypothetical protein